MIGRRAEVVAVGDTGERHAVAPRALDRFLDRQGASRERQPAGRIHETGGALPVDDLRFRLPVDAALPQVLHVERDPRQTVSGESFHLRRDQRLRRRLRSRARSTRFSERASRKLRQLIDRQINGHAI